MQIFELLGKILTKCDGKVYDKEILFETDTGERYLMYHEQDCFESVRVEEIIGDLADLIGSPIIQAEESSNEKNTNDGSMTWTFYRLATAKGQVVLRWLGESNGFYSEEVSFTKLN